MLCRLRAATAAAGEASPQLCAWLRGVKVQSNELRSGAVIEDKEGRLLEVLKFEHTHGQGRASGFVQLEARDLRTGAKRTERFRPSDAVERVAVEEQSWTFLYAEGRRVVLMHPETFEQLELADSLLGPAAAFLTEGVQVTTSSFGSEVLTARLPEQVELAVQSCGPSAKNDRIDGKQLKAAMLVNGASVQVPGYVKDGDVLVIKPATGEFVRRRL